MIIDIHELRIKKFDGTELPVQLRTYEESLESGESILRLELLMPGETLSAAHEDAFFWALVDLRRMLEKRGILLVCYGSSLNVYPSGMSLSMGYGDMAHRMTMGQPTRHEDTVGIFESGSDVIPATLQEQEDYRDRWIRSLE